MGNLIGYIIEFAIVIFSLSVHEASHAYAAYKLGDNTAKDEGRISLNPLVHIDWFNTVLLPLLLIYLHSPIVIGAAKPTPVDYSNIKDKRTGMAIISMAGPLSNFLLAVIFALILKYGNLVHAINFVSAPILFQGVIINLVLGVFNLIPIPPLDGSKILFSFAPESWWGTLFRFEQIGFILLLLFLGTGLLERIVIPVISAFGKIFGMSFFG